MTILTAIPLKSVRSTVTNDCEAAAVPAARFASGCINCLVRSDRCSAVIYGFCQFIKLRGTQRIETTHDSVEVLCPHRQTPCLD